MLVSRYIEIQDDCEEIAHATDDRLGSGARECDSGAGHSSDRARVAGRLLHKLVDGERAEQVCRVQAYARPVACACGIDYCRRDHSEIIAHCFFSARTTESSKRP